MSNDLVKLAEDAMSDADSYYVSNAQAAAVISALRPVMRNEALEEAAKMIEQMCNDPLTKMGEHHKIVASTLTAKDWMQAALEDAAKTIRVMKSKDQ